MLRLHSFALMLDRFSERCGRLLSYLLLALTVVIAAVVLLRYGFNIGSIALQESATYLHGGAFMLAVAYTMKHDGHVRVDIFYRRMSQRSRAWIDSLGALLFLLPLCAFIGASSLDYVAQSWQIRESSPEAGGLPALYLLKTLIPALALTLAVQGIAELLHNALLLCGLRPSAEIR